MCGGECAPAAQQRARKGKGTARPTRATPFSLLNGGWFNAKAGDGGRNAGAPSKKSSGGQKRSNLTLDMKADVLDHLNKKMKPGAMAE